MTSAAEAKEKLVARLYETLKRQEEVKETPDHVGPTTGTRLLEVFRFGEHVFRIYIHISQKQRNYRKLWVFEGKNDIFM